MTAPHALTRSSRRAGAALRRGLSLVELMVGIAVGMFIVAAATVLVTGQLAENRRLLLETQLNQDLRAAMDIVTRELRRSGAAVSPETLAASPGVAAQDNAFMTRLFTGATPVSGPVSVSDLTFYYHRRVAQQGPWRFQLVGGVLKTRVSFAGALQDLTDPSVVVVDTFRIDVRPQSTIRIPCPNLCPGQTITCWPQVTVREFDVLMVARARADPTVTRTLRSTVRARNDVVRFNSGTPAAACPA